MRYEKTIAGINTCYLDSGGDATEAVVFVHGNPGSGEDFDRLVSEVGEFGRALAPTMPGFGKSGKPDDFGYNVEAYAQHLDAFLTEMGVERVHLALHDFGGPWGLAWAMANPDLVASMTLFNIGVLRGYKWHFMARIWQTPLLGELSYYTNTRFGFRQLLHIGTKKKLPRDFVDRMYEDFDKETHRAVLRLYRSAKDIGEATDMLHEALKPLDLPALVIWGRCDIFLPERFAEQQRDTFPRAEVIYFDDSGHWPFVDNADRASEAVLPFLRTQLGVG